jgi:hypothetical protein
VRSWLTWAALVLVVAGVGAALWYALRRDTSPYTVSAAALSDWTVVTSDGTDPWVVALQPPSTLTSALFADVSRRTRTTLIAPRHPALPLVLQTEFEEALQGVYGSDSVMRMAHDAGVDTTAFAPVCLAHRSASGPSGRAELYFVPFEAAAFNQFRVDLTPTEPEHAGIGIYAPGTLSPILIIGATDAHFERWWPLAFDRARDCVAELATVGASAR